MHPPKPKPSTQVVTQGTKVPTEGSPGVVNPSQALLLPRSLRPHCVRLETPKREGDRLVPWAHTCQLERWHHLLDPAEGCGWRRRRCSPSEVLSLPPPAQSPAPGRPAPSPVVTLLSLLRCSDEWPLSVSPLCPWTSCLPGLCIPWLESPLMGQAEEQRTSSPGRQAPSYKTPKGPQQQQNTAQKPPCKSPRLPEHKGTSSFQRARDWELATCTHFIFLFFNFLHRLLFQFFMQFFKGYTPLKVITKYWLYSLCHTVHPCSLSYT